MAGQWANRLNTLTQALQAGRPRSERDAAISSLQTPIQKEQVDNSVSIIQGKITVLEGIETDVFQDLLKRSIKTGLQSREAAAVSAARLDKLPFAAATVSDALRHIGIPETRINQLLLQLGLQSLAHASPDTLTPAQMKVLSLVAALHGPQPTIVLSRPFDGLDPAVARKLSDFIAVAALERKKAFVLLNPGHTADVWKGNDWANWQQLPGQLQQPPRFGGMNLNIPQELLELQMARSALASTRASTDRNQEEIQETPGIEFLEEKLERNDPFRDRAASSRDESKHLSHQTQQEGREGFFMLPITKRKWLPRPSAFKYFSRDSYSKVRAGFYLAGSILMISAACALFWHLRN